MLACLALRWRGCVPAALLRCGFADAAALLVLPACVERHLKLLALPVAYLLALLPRCCWLL